MLSKLILCFCLISSVYTYFQGRSSFTYGEHHPDGDNVVNYMTGPYGPWMPMTNLQYIWNYYEQYATPEHPFNKSALISAANGPAFTTRDANGYLLWDKNHDNEVDSVANYGNAFCEHSGTRFIGDTANYGGRFTNFWFDDNTLANIMSIANAIQTPSGLSTQTGFVRWQIVSGDNTNWRPYNQNYPDTLSLDGLYYLTRGDIVDAQNAWQQIMNAANPQYNQNDQEYKYPSFQAPNSYYLGLVKILTDFLALATGDVNGQYTQHSVSLRSAILYDIQTNQQQGGSLINTETMSAWLLGLATGAYAVYESNTYLQNNNGPFFYRPYHALSAVNGISNQGYLSYGPYASYPIGSYEADFYLRVHLNSPDQGPVVTIDVHDATADKILAIQDLNAAYFTGHTDLWVVASLLFNVTDPTHQYEFRTYWHGTSNTDISSIRLRALSFPAPPAPATTGSLTTQQACTIATPTTGSVTTHSQTFTCPSTSSQNPQYYCNGQGGFIECFGGRTYNFNCGSGTSCKCGFGVECSNGGQTSPCT